MPIRRLAQLVSGPANLGLSREACIVLSIGGFVVTLMVLIVGVLVLGVNERNGPILILVISLTGTSLGGLVGSLKATEAADTAAKTRNLSELTASQNATIQQMIVANCANLCPRGETCGLKEKEAPA